MSGCQTDKQSTKCQQNAGANLWCLSRLHPKCQACLLMLDQALSPAPNHSVPGHARRRWPIWFLCCATLEHACWLPLHLRAAQQMKARLSTIIAALPSSTPSHPASCRQKVPSPCAPAVQSQARSGPLAQAPRPAELARQPAPVRLVLLEPSPQPPLVAELHWLLQLPPFLADAMRPARLLMHPEC